MSKVKTKALVKKYTSDDTVNAFSDILNAGTFGSDIDMEVIYPKYREIRDKSVSILNLFANFQKKFFPNHPHWGHIGKKSIDFTNNLIIEFKKEFTNEKIEEKLIGMFDHMSKEDRIKFGDRYKAIKECNFIKRLIVYCKNIKLYHKYLFPNEGKCDINFIKRIPGLRMSPFEPDFDINFKDLFISNKLSNEDKQDIENLLKTYYEVSYSIYKLVISPDVNIDLFVEMLMTNIDQIKVAVPRCENAFKMIENATSMFKGNFNDYYKQFVITKNPSMILESFIIDVSKSDNVTPGVATEFTRILSFFKKNQSSSLKKDKNASNIMDKLSQNISLLEEIMGKSTNEDNVILNDESSSSSSTSHSSSNVDNEKIDLSKLNLKEEQIADMQSIYNSMIQKDDEIEKIESVELSNEDNSSE